MMNYGFDFQWNEDYKQNQHYQSLITQHMIKYCFLVLLLVAAYAQDEQIIMVSNSVNTLVQSTAEDKSFTSRFDTKSAKRADFSRQAANAQYTYSNVGDAEWIFPQQANPTEKKIWGLNFVAKYSFCVCSDCPKNPATIYVGATSFFVLTHANGTFIGSGWGWSPLTAFTLSLKCGCDNKFILYVYNFWSSPLGAIVYVKQSTNGCYNCTNLGITHYNRDTCKCECINNQTCPCPVKNQVWMDYPTCNCMCSQSLPCNWRQYFDMKNCVCACKKICCPKGFYQNKQTCNCQWMIRWGASVEPSPIAASLSLERDCIQTMICQPPTKWSQKECQCI